MTTITLNISEIISDPKIRSGRPVIVGTGISVSDIVIAHTTGNYLTAEQLADNYRLSLGQVYAALAYYYLHQAEIDAEIDASKTETNRLIIDLEQQGKLTCLD